MAEAFARYRQASLGIGPTQIKAMQDDVERGIRGDAFGISRGQFDTPAGYGDTEMAKVSSRHHEFHDTHDRDLRAVYQGIGYLPPRPRPSSGRLLRCNIRRTQRPPSRSSEA